MPTDSPTMTNRVSSVLTTDWPDFLGPYTELPSPRRAVSEFYLMSRFDPVIKITMATIRSTILSKIGRFVHEDEKISDFVNLALNNISGGIEGVFQKLMSALWAGFCVCEPIWKTSADAWIIDKIVLVHPLSIFDDFGNCGISMNSDGELEFVQFNGRERIKLKDVIYWAFDSELDEEILGNSMLSGARRAWYSKIYTQNFLNTYSEKLAMPTPIFFTPIEEKIDPITGQTMSIAEIITNFYDILQPGQALAVPVTDPNNINMNQLSPSQTATSDFFDIALQYWDTQMFLAMMTPNMLLTEPEHSSRAQSQVNLNVYHGILDGIRKQIGRVVVEQIVAPIIEYNFGETEDVGSWQFEPFESTDSERLAKIFETITSGLKNIAEIDTDKFGIADDELKKFIDIIINN